MIYTIYTIPQPNPYKILLLMMLECSYANSDRIPLEFWTRVYSCLSGSYTTVDPAIAMTW